ncbi:MAG: gamma-glutamylcyclotransferase [Planctomycetes bacterium]|nr:gamma-glutamylcyclotransferase [Planctomycetota bacterium]
MPADPVLPTVLRATAARRNGSCDAEAEAWLEAQFGCSRRLAVYGTLAPGEANTAQLAGCHGRWTQGAVTGRRARRRYPVFTFDPAAPTVSVQVLESPGLAGQWHRLDAFEGAGYRRILVPVRGPAGALTVANLYEAVRPVPTGRGRRRNEAAPHRR